MLWTICRLDKLAAARRAFEELGMMDGTTASYTAMIQAGGVPQPRAVVEAANDDDDDNDNDPSPGPKTLLTVELAWLPGKPFPVQPTPNLINDHTIYSTRLPEHD